ncbi:HNH endonuclease [Paenibacillus sp. OV219]|uniref:HNH endonuclease n=1 Tax=Paenibacillus sp. OV219 TaxID=1884377 RepID=UPI0008CE438D|nr:HNH endonuclease [Paenibacillus sp. OV219]SEP01171.1 HNH endonuclease [Paenibacillus sp. OV219]
MKLPYTLTTTEKTLVVNNLPLNPDSWEQSKFDNLKAAIRAHLININIIHQSPVDGVAVTSCFYCKSEFNLTSQVLHIEHILNKKHYPAFTFEPHNLTIACPVCNSSKGTQAAHSLPVGSSGTYPISNFRIIHAYFDNYEDHIELQDEVFHFGLTPVGEETIRICRLYRSMLAEELAKQAQRRKSDDTEGLSEKLIAAKSSSEIHHLTQSIDSLTLKLRDLVQIRKLMRVVNGCVEVKATLTELRDRFDLFSLLTAMSEEDFDILMSFLNSFDTFNRINRLIQKKQIKKEIDEIIGSDLSLSNSQRMKTIINILVTQTSSSHKVVNIIKKNYSDGFTDFCEDLCSIQETANNFDRIRKCIELLSAINRTQKVKRSLLGITEQQINTIQLAISGICLSPLQTSENRLFLRSLNLLFMLRNTLFHYNFSELASKRDLVNKLGS